MDTVLSQSENELGNADAMSANGEGPASSSPPDTFVVGEGPQDTEQIVTLDNPALQAPESPDIVRNKDGTVRRKPGRKPGQQSGTGQSSVSNVTAKVKTPAQKKAETLTNEQTALFIITMTSNMLIGGIGKEWEFNDQQEADTIKAVTTAYLESKGGAGLSPESMLLLTLSAYAMPRFQHENTRTKLGAFFGSAWQAFKSLFRR